VYAPGWEPAGYIDRLRKLASASTPGKRAT